MYKVKDAENFNAANMHRCLHPPSFATFLKPFLKGDESI